MNIRLILFLCCLGTLNSCSNVGDRDITKHYSEEILEQFEKRADLKKSRDTAIYLLDSLYSTFTSISLKDRYRYFDFKREMVERIRYSDQSYDTAINYLDTMIAIIEDNGLQQKMSKEYVKAFSIRAEYFTRLQRYSEAIQDAARCKQLYIEAGDSCLMAENTKTLSYIAYKQDNLPLAISLLKEALILKEFCKNDREQFVRTQRYLDDLGVFFVNEKKYDSAILYHFAAADYVLQNKRLMGDDTQFVFSALENIYGNLGDVYLRTNNYRESEKYIRESMRFTKDTAGIAQMQSLLGIIYLKSGKIKAAEDMAEKAALALKNLQPIFKRQLYQLQSNIAKAQKNYEKAFYYHEKLLMIKDSIYQERIELIKKNPFVQYEQLDKKYQVELLTMDNRNQQNKTNAAIIIGILLTLLTVISFYFIWRLRIVMKKRSVLYKQLKRTTEEKEKAEKLSKEKELFALEMQLQMEFNESIIQQRRQISDDMHDELSSSLAALKYYVEDVKNKSVGTTVEKPLLDITEEVNSVYKNARNYMHGLKTSNWETPFSLIGFLKELQQKFLKKGLMNVKLSLAEEGVKSLLSTHQHDQLYHIIKEAISNVIKHASATELSITIEFSKNTCISIIKDNGIGFNNKIMVYGIGLQSIKNRVNDLEGTVEVTSTQNGVNIKIEFPLH